MPLELYETMQRRPPTKRKKQSTELDQKRGADRTMTITTMAARSTRAVVIRIILFVTTRRSIPVRRPRELIDPSGACQTSNRSISSSSFF